MSRFWCPLKRQEKQVVCEVSNSTAAVQYIIITYFDVSTLFNTSHVVLPQLSDNQKQQLKINTQ